MIHPRSTRGDARPRLEVERFLLYQLSMLSRRLGDALHAGYGPRHGISRAQWRMLALIGERPKCTAAELVRRASMDAVAVHRAVGQLIDAGLVLRGRSSADGRVKPLRLSARGQRVYEEIVPAALALERRVLDALPPEHARSLQAALAQLMAMPLGAAGALPRDGPGGDR